ncbi:MAG: hypothetical protein AAGF85_00655 [Bacteroidota bacterium]
MADYEKKWYDNAFLVHVLIFFIFPVGLYALWKSRTIATWWKVIASLFVASCVYFVIISDSPELQNEIADQCGYSSIEYTLMKVKSDEVISTKTIQDCFTIKRGELQSVEVSNADGSFRVLYYDEFPLKFLDILEDSIPSRWRDRDGHDLYSNEKDGVITLIFGDRKDKKIKGTLKLIP